MTQKQTWHLLLCFTIALAVGCGSPSGQPVSLAIIPQAIAIAPDHTIDFGTLGGQKTDVIWSATAGTIDATGRYTAPSTDQSMVATVVATSVTDPSKRAYANVHIVIPGHVLPTANPQVALYTISPPSGGTVSVQFGPDTNYGLTTWSQPVPQGGGPVNLLVAGMKANSQYHLRGVVQLDDGSQFVDGDQTFASGAIPAAQQSIISAMTNPGTAPSPGVELLNLIQASGTTTQLVATDLSGHIIWSYTPALPGLVPQPIKLLPNGHFLVNFNSMLVDGFNSVLQEVDLSGTVAWQMTAADLNAALATATCAGCNITVIGTHHDFTLLPNGHLILIAATQKVISGTTATGDVLIDLDQNHRPVWLWNSFDHLDINRRPMGFPDWTHTNAVLYSADDGNLLVSMRHQNLILKIHYADGGGTGEVLWKLGYQGDFVLTGGTDPTDWFYAQHGPSFVTTDTAERFSLILFDNGDDRQFSPGVSCGVTGSAPCLYSTVAEFRIDESARTATLSSHLVLPYSFFGGNAEVLSNGDLEYCASAEPTGLAGDVYEITLDNSAQTVWHLNVKGQNIYRGKRIPSLYPNVQW